MALIDRMAARREIVRADPVSMEEFGYMLGERGGTVGKTRTGVAIGERRALGISAWYSGVRYIAETLAGLPCHTYRQGATGRALVGDRPWKRRPDEQTIWFAWVEFTVFCLLHRGNAYSWKVRNDAGQVMGLRQLHPDRVQLVQAPDGMKLFLVDQNRDRPYSPREILHIPALSTDGIVGLNPIAAQAETLGIVAAGDEYAGRAFAGNHLRAYLSVPSVITGAQAEELKEVWEKGHRGLMTAHEIAVMGGGAEYKTLGLDPQQTQLLESRKFGVSEVSRILRLPPHKLYDLERATFSNIEHQSIEAVVDGIRPWAARLEAWVNSDPDLTSAPQFIEFDLEGLMRGDLKSFMEAWGTGVQQGIVQPSEPRRRLNLPYVEGSDFLLRPLAQEAYGADGHMHQTKPVEVPV